MNGCMWCYSIFHSATKPCNDSPIIYAGSSKDPNKTKYGKNEKVLICRDYAIACSSLCDSVNSVFSMFNPSYDADGNMTSVQTSTGTWTIEYNAENRPVRWTNAATGTVITMTFDSQGRRTEYKSVTNGVQNMWLCFLYDSQGRRFEKKVTVAGITTLHHRYIYRGYLQIATLDLARSVHPALWFVTWDPSQPTAIQKDGTWFTYGYDLTKNICEVFGPAGYIRTAYAYAPFGAVTASDNGVTQPFQWSSEHYDSELDLVYYNFRHYSPSLGRFLSRDPIEEQGRLNLYAFVENAGWSEFDLRGLRKWKEEDSDCCEGKLYNDKTECCLQGRIISRKLHGYTGVSYYVRRSRFYHIPIYNPLKIEQFFLMHAWFKIGEMRAGSYPGKIDLKEEEYSKVEDSILTFKTDIVLPVCKYDIESFKECVESRAREDALNGILWEPWANNCRDWIRRVINDCKFASRRAEK